MTTKQDFSDAEWRLLLDVPVLAGFLVSIASESGPIGTLREIWQSVTGLAETAHEQSGSPLIAALEADLEQPTVTADSAAGRATAATGDADNPEQFRARVLESCRAANGLLSAKATPDEVLDYRIWVLAAAESVATVAKEGGFLGIGGQRVSPAEGAALVEIAEALGAPPPTVAVG